MIAKISVKKGTQRSWDREVGYGKMPEWYQEPFDIEIEIQEIDLAELTNRVQKNY